MKLALVIALLCLAPARALAITRYALVVGNDFGDRDEQRLRYAEHDADRFAATLVDLGGFAPGDVVVLRGADADRARAALISLNDRIRTAGATDAMLVVYYSGHADAEALHLGTSEFPLSQLEQLVRGSPAAYRLLVVDACRSGALTRVKGGKVGAAFPIELGDTLTADGVAFWTASAASEAAQESDAIKGSFFSHFLVSGLAGPADRDGDGTVTTTEAYDYAQAATLRASSRTLAGLQHPTFRDEVAGRDAIVLTRPGTLGPKRGVVRVPEGRDVLVLAGSADGPVIAEVGAHDSVRTLNVRAGRYFIRERTETHLLEGTIAIAAGDDHAIADNELTKVDYERVADKGGGLVLERPRHDRALGGFLVRTAIVDGGDPCAGAFAGYAIDLGWVSVTPRLAACREQATNAVLTTVTDAMIADVRVAHAWRAGPLAVEANAKIGGAALHQHFDTEGIAPSRTVGAAVFGAGAMVGIAVGHGATAGIAAEIDTFVLRRDAAMSARWDSSLGFAGMLEIGVGL